MWKIFGLRAFFARFRIKIVALFENFRDSEGVLDGSKAFWRILETYVLGFFGVK